MEVKEIQIPVHWGFIAAKTWGNETNPVVLAIHGWGDNANSYDALIPLLSNEFYYICVDLPSHGKSSHLQVSLLLHAEDYILVFKMIYDYLKKDKIIILSHSLGAFLATQFAQYFPKCVSKLICFDVLYFFPKTILNHFEKFKAYMNGQNRFFQKKNGKQPTYTKEEAIQKLLSNRLTKISKQSMKILIERNLEPTEDGRYKITVPQHVKFMIPNYITREDAVTVTKRYPIRCPHLVIFSTNSYHCFLAQNKLHELFKKNPDYEFHVVEGTHEVHIENAENVATIVNDFLLKLRNKL